MQPRQTIQNLLWYILISIRQYSFDYPPSVPPPLLHWDRYWQNAQMSFTDTAPDWIWTANESLFCATATNLSTLSATHVHPLI